MLDESDRIQRINSNLLENILLIKGVTYGGYAPEEYRPNYFEEDYGLELGTTVLETQRGVLVTAKDIVESFARVLNDQADKQGFQIEALTAKEGPATRLKIRGDDCDSVKLTKLLNNELQKVLPRLVEHELGKQGKMARDS